MAERVLLVSINLESEKGAWPIEDIAGELEELSAATRVCVVDNIICPRDKPTPGLFIGKGKAEEITALCSQENIDTVIFSHDLSGTQQRNLEAAIGKKIIDRTQLILDIFAWRAKSPEGKMQVELAQLEYLMPRLIGKGIILSRLGGGIGTRGPGEQKLEMDRRRIRGRIDKLKDDLKQLKLHRQTMRKKRKGDFIPSVTLVGYTSAGKSTLLNTLTDSAQAVSAGLFTTLDPLSRALRLPNGENIILSDTVGFLHNLPHHLIEAFKTTLEEAQEADLLIHVLDIAHALAYEHAQAVQDALKELGAEGKPIITVLNKIDLVEDKPRLEKFKADFSNPVEVSAKFKTNLDILLAKIQENFKERMNSLDLFIPHSRMELLNLIYKQGRVAKAEYLPDGIRLSVNLPKLILHNLLKYKEIRIIE